MNCSNLLRVVSVPMINVDIIDHWNDESFKEIDVCEVSHPYEDCYPGNYESFTEEWLHLDVNGLEFNQSKEQGMRDPGLIGSMLYISWQDFSGREKSEKEYVPE